MILLIILVKSLLPKKKAAPVTTAAAIETTAQAVSPTESAAETEAPTQPATTAAPKKSYRIKGSVVNIRYFDNQNRIYTQLTNGTVIGPVTEIAGSDFVRFSMDGIDVVVNKNFIELNE